MAFLPGLIASNPRDSRSLGILEILGILEQLGILDA